MFFKAPSSKRLKFSVHFRCKISTSAWLLLFLAPVPVHAQQGVLGRKTPAGHFSFQPVQELLINQSKKIKLAGSGEGSVAAISVKGFEKIEISRSRTLRGDGKGGVFRVAGSLRQRVLPENFNSKESLDLATAVVPLTITLIKDKKSKDFENISANELYVYMAEGEPDQTAQQFVMNAANFSSFDEQLSAIEGFVHSFAQSAAAQSLKTNLQANLQNTLKEFDEGAGMPSLLDAQKMSVLAKKAFPGDVVLAAAALQIDKQIQVTLAACQLLRGLAGLGDWSTFLDNYPKIELHQDSFPDIRALHRHALEEKVHEETTRGRALMTRHKDAEAAREFNAAIEIDRTNSEIEKERKAAHMLAAQAEAKKNAESWKPLPKDSPEDRLFRQALYNADRAIQDKDYAKARDAIQQAERENSTAPQILLARASLLAAGDQISSAVPLLDRYDTLIADPADREKGDAVRNQVEYELRKRKESDAKDIDAYLAKGEIARVYAAVKDALKLDNTEPSYLYSAALSAAILNKSDEAEGYITSYLKYSDTLAADDTIRARVRRIQKALKTPRAPEPTGTANWFSGRKVPDGSFYCPASLAFQPVIESVAGFKFKIDYFWANGHLSAIHSNFEDEKGRLDYSTMIAAAAGGQEKSPDRAAMGTFTFVYGQGTPGVRVVSAGNAANEGKAAESDPQLVKNADGSVHLLSAAGTPQIILEGDPLMDPEVVRQVMGPVATVVSGNSYFNPFVWDGIHHFTVTYDDKGRISTAKEWNTENTAKFTWDGFRLTEISVARGNDAEPIYRNTITYSGRSISSEDYTAGPHSGHIKYTYVKDKLATAKMEDHGVYDGKAWTVRFQ